MLGAGQKAGFIEAVCHQALLATSRLSSETLAPYWDRFSDMVAIYFGYKEPSPKNTLAASDYILEWRREVRKSGSPLNQILAPYIKVFDKTTLSRADNPLDWDHTGHMPYQCFSKGWDGLMGAVAEIPMPESHRLRVDQIYSYASSMVLNAEGVFVEKGVIGISIGKCLPTLDATLEMMLRKALQRGLYIPPRSDKKQWSKDIRIAKGKDGNEMRRMLGNALCRRKDSPFLVAHKLSVGSNILLNDFSAVIAEDIHPNLSIERLSHHFEQWRAGRILKINKELDNKLLTNSGSYKPRLKQEKQTLQTSYNFGSFAQYKYHIRDQKPKKRVIEYVAPHDYRSSKRSSPQPKAPIGRRVRSKDKPTQSKLNQSLTERLSLKDLEQQGFSLTPDNVSFRVSPSGTLSSALSLSRLEKQKYGVKRGQVVLGAKTIQLTKLPSGRYKIIRTETYDSAGTLVINEDGIIKVRRIATYKIVLSDGVVSYIKRINKQRTELAKKTI